MGQKEDAKDQGADKTSQTTFKGFAAAHDLPLAQAHAHQCGKGIPNRKIGHGAKGYYGIKKSHTEHCRKQKVGCSREILELMSSEDEPKEAIEGMAEGFLPQPIKLDDEAEAKSHQKDGECQTTMVETYVVFITKGDHERAEMNHLAQILAQFHRLDFLHLIIVSRYQVKGWDMA